MQPSVKSFKENVVRVLVETQSQPTAPKADETENLESAERMDLDPTTQLIKFFVQNLNKPHHSAHLSGLHQL